MRNVDFYKIESKEHFIMHKTINSTEFRKMILVGAKQLELNRAKVDALNVFPVPDGDINTVARGSNLNTSAAAFFSFGMAFLFSKYR